MHLDRRSVMKGIATASLAGSLPSLAAAEGRSLFDQGPLARNPIARSFVRLPAQARPPVTALLGSGGAHHMSELTGKVRIVSLWAEWCIPCLIEAKDLSRLRTRFAGPQFDVLAILTAGRAHLSFDQAGARLTRVGATNLPTWVEPDGGRTVGQALAVDVPPHISLPCNLIIDREGRVRGRSVGIGTELPKGPTGVSHWAMPDAQAFVIALRDGALDRL